MNLLLPGGLLLLFASSQEGYSLSSIGLWLPDVNWPILIYLPPLQRAEAKSQAGLAMGLILRFGKAAEFTGPWDEARDCSHLGLPLALSELEPRAASQLHVWLLSAVLWEWPGL